MKESIFQQFPKLDTERLVLREVREHDLEMVFSFNADPEALRYVAREYYTDIKEAVVKLESLQAGFHDHTGLIWTFALRETDEPLGYGGFFDISENRTEAEIGDGILNAHWGKGYVFEAVKAMTNFGFSKMDLERIFGRIDPENIPSARILKKLGYQNEGVILGDEFARGQTFDMAIWARQKEQE